MAGSWNIKDKARSLSFLKNGDARPNVSDLAAPPLPLHSQKTLDKPKITVIDYSELSYHEAEAKDVSE